MVRIAARTASRWRDNRNTSRMTSREKERERKSERMLAVAAGRSLLSFSSSFELRRQLGTFAVCISTPGELDILDNDGEQYFQHSIRSSLPSSCFSFFSSYSCCCCLSSATLAFAAAYFRYLTAESPGLSISRRGRRRFPGWGGMTRRGR